MIATMSTSEAQAFRDAYGAEVSRLSRKTRTQLRQIDAAALTARGMQRLYGGPQSKDELISEILGFSYPVDRLNETTHVLYHKPGENWSACDLCQANA